MSAWSVWRKRVFLTSSPVVQGFVAVIFFATVWLRLSHPEAAYFNEFAERDWYRTWEIYTGRHFHLSGSELTQGGRLPGPWMYWIQLLPMCISINPRSLLYFIGVLNLAAVYLCYRMGARFFSPAAGAAAMGLFAAFPMASVGLRYLWNPTLMFPFTAATLYALAAAADRPRPFWLYVAAVSIPIATNCHISGLYLFAIVLSFIIIFRPGFQRRHYLTALAISGAMFLPFLAGEVRDGFPNVRPIISQQETWRMAGYEHKPSVRGRYQFNSSAIHGFLFNVYPRTWDESYFGAFTYYLLFLKQAPHYFGRIGMSVIQAVQDMARFHLVVFCAALVWAVWQIVAIRRRPDWRNVRGRLALLSLCTALLGLVLGAQSGMAFSAGGGKLGTGVHYFFIIYPAQFLLTGAFIQWVSRYFSGSRILRIAIWAILGLWLVLQGAFVTLMFDWSRRSGYIIQFIETPVANLGVCQQIADALVKDLGITRATYPTHVQELDRILNYGWGTESGLDFLVNRHPLIQDAPPDGAPPAPFVYIIDRSLPHPDLAGFEIERQLDIGPISLCVSRQGTPRVWDPRPLPPEELSSEFPRPLVRHNPMMNPFIHYDVK
ncbi:MAG: hypothetical protein Kow0059_10830 [Candidatus Sumerlaeia bacterium]